MERHIPDLIKKGIYNCLPSLFFMNSVVNLLVFNFSNVSSVDVCCDNLIAEFRRCYSHKILKMLMDFVKSLSLFGEKALVEWMTPIC